MFSEAFRKELPQANPLLYSRNGKSSHFGLVPHAFLVQSDINHTIPSIDARESSEITFRL
jgi:hypothetical protein